LEDKNAIGQVDAKTNTVIHTWPLGTCDEPSGLAIEGRQLQHIDGGPLTQRVGALQLSMTKHVRAVGKI
jgi:hypothetical protein